MEQEITHDDLPDFVSKALRQAWLLGQTYWQQADSDSYSDNRRSDITQTKFQALVEETRAAITRATKGD